MAERPLTARAEALARDPRLPAALAAAAIAVVAVILLAWLSELTFWRDEWAFLLHRRGFNADAFMRPNYEHFVAGAVVVYKALQATFGMDSPAPFQFFFVATFAASIAMLFVYVRRATDPWFAFAAILPILVLGTSPEDLLWPFQMGFTIGMCLGLGALLALERRDRRGDVLACVLLTLALTPSSLGVAFIPGAIVSIAWDRDRWRRAWIVAIPIVVYGLWWLGWGHTGPSYVSLHNILTAPGYVLDGFASSLGSLSGIAAANGDQAGPLEWGRPLLAAAVAAGIWRLHRVGRLSRSLCVVLAIGIAFWALAAFNASLFREATSGRYQYMGAVFTVMIAAELLRGVRFDLRVAAAVVAVGIAAAASNFTVLHSNWVSLTSFGQLQPAALAALEIARDEIDPAFELTFENSDVDYLGELDAGSYLSAVDAFGSPAFSEPELVAAPEEARVAADKVFGAGLGVALGPATGAGGAQAPAPTPVGTAAAAAAGPGCVRVELTPGAPAVLSLPPGGADLEAAAGAEAKLALHRYAIQTFPVELGSLAAGEAAGLAIPADASGEPWELALSGDGAITVCGGAR